MAFAQDQVLFNETTNPSFECKYKNTSEGNQAQINTIIQLLSKESNLPLRNTLYSLTFTQQLKVTRNGKQYDAEIKIKSIASNGNNKFQDFDISDELQPDHLLIDITIVANNNLVKNTYKGTLYKLNPNQQELNYTFTDSTLINKIKIEVNNVQFIYTQQDIGQLQNKINLVKDYYSTDVNLQTTYKNLQNIDPVNLDLIAINNTTLSNAEALIEKLKKEDYTSKLNLQKNDPIKYIQKLNGLIELAAKIRKAIDFTLKTLDQLYYTKGVDLLSYGKFEIAKDCFMKSISYNPMFAPSHFQLAKMDYENGNMIDAEIRAKDILYKMNPDPLTNEAVQKLLYNICDFYFVQAKNRIKDHQYEAALDQLYKMQNLCSSVPNMICNQEMYAAIGEAKLGIYHTILDNAKIYLAKGDLKSAEQKVHEAADFQKNNSKYITNNVDGDDLLRQIYFNYYTNHINMGKQYINNTNYEAALDELDDAEKIEKDFGFNRNQDLSPLEKLAAKPIITKLIIEGNANVKQNLVSSAKNNINKIEKTQAKYGLSDNKELNVGIDELKQKLYTQECINANNHYNELIENANKKVFNKQFIDAQNILNEAKNYASSNGICVISPTIVDEKLNEIVAAATYQSMLLETNSLITSHKYDYAIQKYIDANKYYEQYKVSSFGLAYTTTYQYILNNNNNELKIFGANYYLNQKDYASALSLLADAANKNYSSSVFKQVQMRFGREKAIIDKGDKPAENPKNYVLNYTSGNKKLKFLQKAYIKQWKKMK